MCALQYYNFSVLYILERHKMSSFKDVMLALANMGPLTEEQMKIREIIESLKLKTKPNPNQKPEEK